VSEPAGVDANVLVYAHDDSSPYQDASKALLEDRDSQLYLSPQVLAEFFAVVTNPRRVTHPLSAEEALSVIDTILAQPNVELLPVPVDIVSRWADLVRVAPVTGARIFDVQLAATLLANGIQRLYTFNVGDFKGLNVLAILTP